MASDGARRAEILETAGTLFASSGLQTTLKEIADACGILPGSLYHHFDSKEAIVIELVRHYREDLDRVAGEASGRTAGTNVGRGAHRGVREGHRRVRRPPPRGAAADLVRAACGARGGAGEARPPDPDRHRVHDARTPPRRRRVRLDPVGHRSRVARQPALPEHASRGSRRLPPHAGRRTRPGAATADPPPRGRSAHAAEREVGRFPGARGGSSCDRGLGRRRRERPPGRPPHDRGARRVRPTRATSPRR